MKRILLMLSILFITCLTLHAQTLPVTDWKTKVLGTWKYLGEEQFGVVTEPDSVNANNSLTLRDDLTFEKKDASIVSTGTYVISEAAKTITFKDIKTGKSKMYYLKKSDPDFLIIEFQTPDLIRTRYKYGATK